MWVRAVEALQAKLGTLSLEAQSKLEKDTAKKEAKAEAKADAALKKKMVCLFLFISNHVTIVLLYDHPGITSECPMIVL